MLKKLTLLMMCVSLLAHDALAMNADVAKDFSYLAFKHTTPEWLMKHLRGFTTNTTLALPAIDVISYCALKFARKLLAQNPQALHAACRSGDLNKVQLLIAAGARVNAQGEYGWTSFHWAAYFNFKNIAKLLIHYGAPLDVRNVNGQTPLHCAMSITDHSKEVVKLLINRGASVSACDNDGRTPLHVAALWNYKEIARLILSNAFFHPSVISLPLRNGTSNLQELCLRSLLNNLNNVNEHSLNNVVIPCIAHNLDTDPARNKVLHMLAHHAPLSLQRKIVKVWQHHTSQEHAHKIQLFLETHLERHSAKIKELIAHHDKQHQTARDLGHNNPAIVALLDNVARACTFKDLDKKLQQAIKRTLKSTLEIR